MEITLAILFELIEVPVALVTFYYIGRWILLRIDSNCPAGYVWSI